MLRHISSKDGLKEITSLIHISSQMRQINTLLHIGKTVQVVWEYIVAFVFTSDGFGIQTKDEFIIKCKDQ